MSAAPVRRPTEDAAMWRACRSARHQPSAPALLAALLDANERRDREGVCLAAHRLMRAATTV
ncbi:hypothetical protein ACFXGG_33570 [Streptomyces nigra]|uniref:hypothetical protein n=1 Tax=Streptomyces nigra TaxID=1827580 RepID=UPI00367C0797